MNFISNPQLELAFDYVRNTNKNIFLTGKAGTGKTTFLHKLKSETVKRMVVVAPTGVAAINAGGMTIHSFFQLPFGLFLPGVGRDQQAQRHFRREKINLIRSLDLLVIDEISMVRADLLDGVDEVLRRYRGNSLPFGGVQLLMIGDLHQLPPVVKNEDWEMLRDHYDTPYFFGSLSLRKTDPVSIELKHIYRQADSFFIDLLNKVRNNKMDTEVLETLNSRYIADFRPSEKDGYIILTSHNAAAQTINTEKLAELPGPSLTFKAEVKGDFPTYSFPTEETLLIRKNAQVMFVKNDLQPEKRYYNGKIGQVTKIEDDIIYVRCPKEEYDIAVSPVTWDNVKYSLNEKTKEVTEELAGSFTQFPLKLAWAITIHKSQGLTFERAIIDAQAAFAHGQVYVALSRCKSFEGIVLRSKIAYSSVKTDSVVKNYTEEADKNAPDEAHLRQSKIAFQQTLIWELFNFKTLKRYFDALNRTFLEHENTLVRSGFTQFKELAALAGSSVFSVAEIFGQQLQSYFAQPEMPVDNEPLQERIKKASTYFSDKLNGELLPKAKSVLILTDNKLVMKSAQEDLENLQREIFAKNACFAVAMQGFSPQDYLRTKANAELDFALAKKAPAAAPPAYIPKEATHPELYAQLAQWRKETAAEMGVELYEVLPTNSLLELVRHLPTGSAALKNVKGIGDVKIKQFGADIIGIIEKYCSEKNIPTDLLVLPTTSKADKPDTKAVSFDLFKSGKSIAEIAAERGFVPATIEGHLTHYVALGELDIFELMTKEDVAEIEQFFVENNAAVSSVAKAHFGEKYSYPQIRMVLGYLKKIEG